MQVLNLQPEREESRRAPRVFMRSIFPRDTVVVFTAQALGIAQKAALHNISRTGCFLKNPACLPANTLVSIRFQIGTKTIICEGKVVYSVQGRGAFDVPGFGVSFTKLYADDQAFIDGIVEEFHSVMLA